MEKKAYIEAGKIVNTHGVAGEVKIEVWLDSPEYMKRFRRLFLGDRELTVEASRVHRGFLLCRRFVHVGAENLCRDRQST